VSFCGLYAVLRVVLARIPGHPQDSDPASPDLEDEEHIDAAQQHGVDGEEVTGQHRRRLDPAELPLRRFTASFDAVFAGVGIAMLRSPPRASRANAYAERWVGTIRRECLDRMLIFHERQLRHVAPIDCGETQRTCSSGPVRRTQVLGGLINEYRHAA
jgi:hypothetical protein